VCIMMSFWGGGPSHYWNFYTWICTGVTIAETIGFHRSMAGANIASQDRSLIKRLWWILVIRDAMCASIVGRPIRIHLEQCDVDALTQDDFVYDDDDDADLSLLDECMRSPLAQQSGAYQMHATKLALLLRHIIAVRFNPKRKQDAGTPAVASLQEMMTAWRRELPREFSWEDHISTHSNVFASTLRILYNHNVILAYVHSSIGSSAVPEHGISVAEASPFSQQATTAAAVVQEEDMLSDAAQQIASVSCNVVMTDDGQLPPHELFHGLFVASVVFYMMQTNGTTGQNALVARAGVSGLMNCKMALHAARDTWDASPWITQLFDKVLCLGLPAAASAADRRAAGGGGGGGSDERGNGDGDGVNAMEGGGGDGIMGFNDLSASFDLDGLGMMAGYYGAAWPNHPFLGQFV
jgi:hypothetical protein